MTPPGEASISCRTLGPLNSVLDCELKQTFVFQRSSHGLFIYLKVGFMEQGGKREGGRERAREILYLLFVPLRQQQRPRLGPSQELFARLPHEHGGPSTWVVLHCFPRCTDRAQKQSSQDKHQCPYRMCAQQVAAFPITPQCQPLPLVISSNKKQIGINVIRQ